MGLTLEIPLRLEVDLSMESKNLFHIQRQRFTKLHIPLEYRMVKLKISAVEGLS